MATIAQKIPKEALLDMLSKMWQIRAFEEKAEALFALGKVHGTMHLSIGQEASAVGAVSALQAGDYMTSTHRGHGHCIAKDADLKLMMAPMSILETWERLVLWVGALPLLLALHSAPTCVPQGRSVSASSAMAQ